MNKPLHLLLALLLTLGWTSPAIADGPPAWTLQGENNTVWLLGSIHLLREQDHPLPGRVDRLWSDSDILVLEVNLGDIDPMEMNRIMSRHGQLPAEYSLTDVLDDTTLARTREMVNEFGLPEDRALQLRPWLLATMLTVLAIENAGYQSALGLDMHLYQRARETNREVRGLESTEDQLRPLYELEAEMEARYLRVTLDEINGIEAQVPEMVRAWRENDQSTLEALLIEGFAEFPELYEAAMAARNRAWVPQIIDMLDDQQDYLVVIGSAHLLGPDNVIELLREQGFEADTF